MFWLQENLILMKEMFKKCSTDQRFILEEITSLKIHMSAWRLSDSYTTSEIVSKIFPEILPKIVPKLFTRLSTKIVQELFHKIVLEIVPKSCLISFPINCLF